MCASSRLFQKLQRVWIFWSFFVICVSLFLSIIFFIYVWMFKIALWITGGNGPYLTKEHMICVPAMYEIQQSANWPTRQAFCTIEITWDNLQNDYGFSENRQNVTSLEQHVSNIQTNLQRVLLNKLKMCLIFQEIHCLKSLDHQKQRSQTRPTKEYCDWMSLWDTLFILL